MLALLLGVLGKAVGWLGQVLPESPFADALPEVDGSLSVALAWLNTFVPVSEIVTLLTVWAGALLIYAGVRFVKRNTVDRIFNVFSLGGRGQS